MPNNLERKKTQVWQGCSEKEELTGGNTIQEIIQLLKDTNSRVTALEEKLEGLLEDLDTMDDFPEDEEVD